MLAPLGIAIQGLLADARAIALQGLIASAAPLPDPPSESGGGRGRGRRPRPAPIDPRALADARDIEALLLSGAL